MSEYLPDSAYIYIYIFFAVVGSLIGSFLNVVIARLPVKGKFLSESRSKCPACGHTIRWYDLFPVISWIVLLGRCRDCKTRISVRYPIVEAAGAFFAVAGIWHFGLVPVTVLVYAVTMILLAISLIDYDTSEIPYSLIIALIPLAIASIWLFPDVTLLSRFIGLFSIALPMILISLIKPGAFGGGDINLMAVCGFMLGWQLILVAFFIGLVICGSIAIFFLLSGKRKIGEHIVFGPSLCVGIAVSIYFGNEILSWYLSFYGF